MIQIINVGPETSDKLGWRAYEIRIGGELIAKFKHKRSDGLAKCLSNAAQAVEHAKLTDLVRLMDLVEKGRRP